MVKVRIDSNTILLVSKHKIKTTIEDYKNEWLKNRDFIQGVMNRSNVK